MSDQNSCIFVNGIWKSGNHLVYSALNELGIEGPFNGIAAHLLQGRHRPVKRLVRGGSGVDVGLETPAPVRPSWIRQTVRRLEGKILGGHAAYSEELLTLMEEQGARVILVKRDPRDILVSFADWIPTRPDMYMHRDFVSLSREHRIERLLHGGVCSGYKLHPFCEILRRAEGWLGAEGRLFVVAFEDLVGPRGGGSFERQEAALRGLCRHLGCDYPQTNDWVSQIYGESLTFNKGRSQRWREIESVALRSEIDELLKPHQTVWGYDQV